MLKKKSTHYVRAIAVFKISLTLCVIHLSSFWMDRERGKPRGRRGGLISSDLQTLRSLVTFSQAETQEEAGYTLFCFFSRQHLVWGFSYKFTHSKPASTPPFLSHTLKHTHKTNACIHTPRSSLATELPLQWDHCFKNKAVGFKSRNILKTFFIFLSNQTASQPNT